VPPNGLVPSRQHECATHDVYPRPCVCGVQVGASAVLLAEKEELVQDMRERLGRARAEKLELQEAIENIEVRLGPGVACMRDDCLRRT
jgi:hypothetical protein